MRSFRARAGLALAILLGSATASAAEDWLATGYANGVTYDIDLSSLSRTGDVVSSWMREDLPKPAKGRNGRPYGQTITQRYDDCAARKFSFREVVRRDAKGEVVETFSYPGGWQDIVPGSVTEALWRAACAATEPPKEKPLLDDIAGETWTALGTSNDKRYVMYADFGRVVRLDKTHVLALTRADYLRPQIIDGLPVRHVVTATVVDCEARKDAEADLDLFMSPKIRVRAQRAAQPAGLTFESPPPGSFAFANLSRFCEAQTVSVDAAPDKETGETSTGTAWLVAKGYLVTADHVIAGASELVVYDSTGEPAGHAEVVSEDAANDLAVLKPVGWKTHARTALPLAVRGASLGKRIFTLGYPEPDTLGQHIKMTAGEVSGTSGPHDDAHDLQISAPIQPGNSGGPVLTWDGAVVGIVDSKLNSFDGDDQSKPELINYAVKAAYLRPMLEDLPDLGGYRLLTAKGGQDETVALARRSVFMVVATH